MSVRPDAAAAPPSDLTAPPSDPLAPEIRRLFGDLAHAGDLAATGPAGDGCEECVLSGAAGSIERGARVRFQLRLRTRDRMILEARYRAYGCPYLLATCEWLARRLAGHRAPEPAREEPTRLESAARSRADAVGHAADWAQALAVPAARLGRLFVIEDALRAALAGVDTR